MASLASQPCGLPSSSDLGEITNTTSTANLIDSTNSEFFPELNSSRDQFESVLWNPRLSQPTTLAQMQHCIDLHVKMILSRLSPLSRETNRPHSITNRPTYLVTTDILKLTPTPFTTSHTHSLSSLLNTIDAPPAASAPPAPQAPMPQNQRNDSPESFRSRTSSAELESSLLHC